MRYLVAQRDSHIFKKLAILYISGFGCGKFPHAPGTVASILFLPFAVVLGSLDGILQLAILIAMTLLGIAAISYIVNHSNELNNGIDKKWIVIDEWIGISVVFAIPNPSLFEIIGGFLLFRYFDIHKWGIVGLIDKRYKNPIGVIGDDVIAGLQAALVLGLFRFLYLGIFT